MMFKLAPSVLSANFAKLEEEIKKVEPKREEPWFRMPKGVYGVHNAYTAELAGRNLFHFISSLCMGSNGAPDPKLIDEVVVAIKKAYKQHKK